MGGGGGSSDNTVRYAEYFEGAHKAILNHGGEDSPSLSVVGAFNTALGTSPFSDTVNFNVRGAFFSEGYVIESFPSLWDMFGKFMAGVDVHTLFLQTYNDVVNSAEVAAAVTAQADYLDDDLNTNIYPRFEAGMRDINAVSSTAFAAGRAIIEDSRIKAINKFSSELRLRSLDIASGMWAKHLEWNQSVISTYSTMFKLYYATEMDVNAQEAEMRMRDATWDLSLFEYVRSMLGVVSGAQGTVNPPEPSQAAKSLSGTLGGASAGYSATGTWQGAAVGGVLGLASSFIN